MLSDHGLSFRSIPASAYGGFSILPLPTPSVAAMSHQQHDKHTWDHLAVIFWFSTYDSFHFWAGVQKKLSYFSQILISSYLYSENFH